MFPNFSRSKTPLQKIKSQLFLRKLSLKIIIMNPNEKNVNAQYLIKKYNNRHVVVKNIMFVKMF